MCKLIISNRYKKGKKMQEIVIGENDAGKRLDRFLRQYMPHARRNILYGALRKKNIVLNDRKAKPETLLHREDRIKIFFKDETIEKFRGVEVEEIVMDHPKVIEKIGNVYFLYKPTAELTHDNGRGEENMADRFVSMLVDDRVYDPREELTFRPALANRLDKNTSGILVGASSAESLRELNELFRNQRVRRLYLTIVEGVLTKTQDYRSHVAKDHGQNKVYESDYGKTARSIFRPIVNNGNYTLIEVELITGRTHQIRHHLEEIGHPILGDHKYGHGKWTSRQGRQVNSQLLHAYKMIFPKLEKPLQELSGKVVECPPEGVFKQVKEELFGAKHE